MGPDCPLVACQFEKIASAPTLILQWIIIIVAAATIGYLWRTKRWPLLKRFWLMALGILIFELFTQPLWNNHNLSSWAYLYVDVSWVLTLGWTLILFYSQLFVDTYLKPQREHQRFIGQLFFSALVGLVAESMVVKMGLRTYTPEVEAVLVGVNIPLLNIPIEGLFYIPLFMTLVLSFVKYWELIINKVPLAPFKNNVVQWKTFILALIAVFLYEVMNEPAVNNAGWPEWSYIYHDVNIMRIVLWVLILGLGSNIVNRVFYHHSPYTKFMLALAVITLITIPIEHWLVVSELRHYSGTLQAGFSGPKIPFTQLPAEILFAIPLYLSLIIGFVRYWGAVWDNDI